MVVNGHKSENTFRDLVALASVGMAAPGLDGDGDMMVGWNTNASFRPVALGVAIFGGEPDVARLIEIA